MLLSNSRTQVGTASLTVRPGKARRLTSRFSMRVQPRAENCVSYTIPFLNSVSEYFVPRHSIPSFHKVRIIDRKSV